MKRREFMSLIGGGGGGLAARGTRAADGDACSQLDHHCSGTKLSKRQAS
jgi:hypothetical protein